MAKKKEYEVNVPGGEEKVLLHTCCAPCSSAIVECLLQHGIVPTIFYCNPNIYPFEEYLKRKDECTRYAESLGLEIVDADYDHKEWLSCVKGLENEPERGNRCLNCFRMRLRKSAEYARDNGYKVITTTLASSRWKSLEQIESAGLEACADISEVTFWKQNWRKGGLSERRSAIIKEMNFYNQTYCGCEFSLPNIYPTDNKNTDNK